MFRFVIKRLKTLPEVNLIEFYQCCFFYFLTMPKSARLETPPTPIFRLWGFRRNQMSWAQNCKSVKSGVISGPLF